MKQLSRFTNATSIKVNQNRIRWTKLDETLNSYKSLTPGQINKSEEKVSKAMEVIEYFRQKRLISQEIHLQTKQNIKYKIKSLFVANS